MMTYRLFLAIDPPVNIRSSIYSLCRGLENIKWVSEEQIHLTLRFIGEADGRVFDDICAALSDLQYRSFNLKVEGVGYFPPRGTPKVLWAGLEESEELSKLYRKINTRLFACGVEREHRKFSPHITLGRLKDETNDNIAGYLSRNKGFHTDSFIANQYHLYASRLTPKGAIHEKLASFLLD